MISQSFQDLSPQKRMFVLEYIKDFKANRAAERAGFPASVGHKFMAEEDVQLGIAAAMEERALRTGIDADWVLTQLGRLFEADLADIFVPGTDTLKPIHEWPEVWRKLCSGIEVNELFEGRGTERTVIGYVKKIKLMDRLRAVELIGKHTNVKAFVDRVEVATEQDLVDRLMRGRQRAREKTQQDEMSFL